MPVIDSNAADSSPTFSTHKTLFCFTADRRKASQRSQQLDGGWLDFKLCRPSRPIDVLLELHQPLAVECVHFASDFRGESRGSGKSCVYGVACCRPDRSRIYVRLSAIWHTAKNTKLLRHAIACCVLITIGLPQTMSCWRHMQ